MLRKRMNSWCIARNHPFCSLHSRVPTISSKWIQTTDKALLIQRGSLQFSEATNDQNLQCCLLYLECWSIRTLWLTSKPCKTLLLSLCCYDRRSPDYVWIFGNLATESGKHFWCIVYWPCHLRIVHMLFLSTVPLLITLASFLGITNLQMYMYFQEYDDRLWYKLSVIIIWYVFTAISAKSTTTDSRWKDRRCLPHDTCYTRYILVHDHELLQTLGAGRIALEFQSAFHPFFVFLRSRLDMLANFAAASRDEREPEFD